MFNNQDGAWLHFLNTQKFVRNTPLHIIFSILFSVFGNRGVARGVLRCPWPPFVSHVLSKQRTTGGKKDMKIWWVTSFLHREPPRWKILATPLFGNVVIHGLWYMTHHISHVNMIILPFRVIWYPWKIYFLSVRVLDTKVLQDKPSTMASLKQNKLAVEDLWPLQGGFR